MIGSVAYFVLRYRRQTLVLIAVLLFAAIAENLTILALFPLSSVVLGTEGASSGPLLDGISSVVRRMPAEQRLAVAVGLFLAVLPLDIGTRLVREWLQARFSAHVAYDTKQRMFSSMRTSSFEALVSTSGGSLTYRLTSAPHALAASLTLTVTLTSLTLTSLVTVGMLLSIEWRVTVALLVLGVLAVGLNRYVARRFAFGSGRARQQAQTAELGLVQEFVAGTKEIMASDTASVWAGRFERESAIYARYFTREAVWSALPGLIMEFLVFVLAGIGIGIVGFVAPVHIVDLVPVAAVYAYAFRRLLGATAGISRQFLRLAVYVPDLELIRRALVEPAPRIREGARTDCERWERLTFEDVTFTYRGAVRPALRDVSVEIPQGVLVALVGPSGSGKTTIANLVLRLLEPTSGQIRLDGTDLSEFSRSAWLSRVGYVGQECFVQSGTVAENIAFGRPCSREAMVRAAALARADDFIAALPLGYDTVLAERGASLSAGQRQRLVIARALVTDPTLLVLDEPTSALDAESEHHIREALGEVRRTCTILVIAHRLGTIRDADRIVVLEDGRVTQEGSHRELERDEGTYARLLALVAR